MHEYQEQIPNHLSAKLVHGRVTNAVSDYFRRTLSIPHIYLEPEFVALSKIDVLAVDRSGSGDLHGVRIQVEAVLPTASYIESLVASITKDFAGLPVHFKYLAINANADTMHILAKLNDYEELFDPSGIGRFGVLAYDECLLAANGTTTLESISAVVKPERFRVRGEKLQSVENFLEQVSPDIQVRV